jgi:hypothetical protein
MKRKKKLRYGAINKNSLTMRKLARIFMPRPAEKHTDRKNDYDRKKAKKDIDTGE